MFYGQYKQITIFEKNLELFKLYLIGVFGWFPLFIKIRSYFPQLDSRIGRQSNLFKHHIIEWQSRGVIPNTDYLITQRKIKRAKSDLSYNPSLPSLIPNPNDQDSLARLMPLHQPNPTSTNAPFNQLMTPSHSFSSNTNYNGLLSHEYPPNSCSNFTSYNSSLSSNSSNNNFASNTNYYVWSGSSVEPSLSTPAGHHMHRSLVAVSPLQHKPLIQPVAATTSIEVSSLFTVWSSLVWLNWLNFVYNAGHSRRLN